MSNMYLDDEELLQIEPTAYALFRHDALNQPRLNLWPKEQLDEIVQRARNGDQKSRDLLVCSCLSFVFYRALRYKDTLQHDDPMDLVSIGAVALLESLEKALYADKPIKFLLSQAAYAIQHYVSWDNPMIKRGGGHSEKYYQEAIPVESFDKEVTSDVTYGDLFGLVQEFDLLSEAEQEEIEDILYGSPLYQAINALTSKQQQVVKRHFGLEGAPETFAEIAGQMHIRPESAWKLWVQARKRLQKLLSS